jgi:hypothetical protein
VEGAVTPKAKRKRQKDRVATEAKILEAARGTSMKDPMPLRYQWLDGSLVHRVVKDRRSFNVNIGGRNNWVTRVVYSTICGHVIAIDLAKFLSSSRPPNCVYCVAPPRHSIGIDLAAGVAWPWDGRSVPDVS